LICLLMAAGLALIRCTDLFAPPKAWCQGSGECTVTVGQGASGLYIDTDAPRSSCGKTGKYSDSGTYSGGCKVQNVIDGKSRTYGKHGCNCTTAS